MNKKNILTLQNIVYIIIIGTYYIGLDIIVSAKYFNKQ